MKILIVAATQPEIKPVSDAISFKHHEIDWCVTGVGMINTCFELTKKLLLQKYDLVLNIGIAGAFDREIKLGDVVWIRSEMFPEMGAEDGDEFLSLIQLGLQGHDEFPFSWGELKDNFHKESNVLSTLKQVRGITVNKVHGNEHSILNTKMRYNPHIESMEGAAVFYVCLKMNIPVVQIRAVSNYVERRNRDAWEISLAITNLTKKTEEFLTQI